MRGGAENQKLCESKVTDTRMHTPPKKEDKQQKKREDKRERSSEEDGEDSTRPETSSKKFWCITEEKTTMIRECLKGRQGGARGGRQGVVGR